MLIKLSFYRPARHIEDYVEVKDMNNLWVAINDFHLDYISCGIKYKDWNYAVIEAGGSKFLSRVAIDGIGRKGGVKPREFTLDEVCDILQVEASDILSDDWIGGDNDCC